MLINTIKQPVKNYELKNLLKTARKKNYVLTTISVLLVLPQTFQLLRLKLLYEKVTIAAETPAKKNAVNPEFLFFQFFKA